MIKHLYTSAILFYVTSVLAACTFVGVEIVKENRENAQIKEDAKGILVYPNLNE